MEKYSTREWTTTKLAAELRDRGLVAPRSKNGTHRPRRKKADMIKRLVDDDDRTKGPEGFSAFSATATTSGLSEHEKCVSEGQRVSQAKKETKSMYDRAATIEKLALHLCCTEQYMNFARGSTMDPSILAVRLSKQFLANVNLAGRWARYKSWGAWLMHFRSHLRDPMLQRVQEIFRTLPARYRTRATENVLAPTASDTSAMQHLRQQTFTYHEKRRALLETVKQCSHQRLVLGQSLTIEFLNTYSSDQQANLRKLYMLQEAEAACQTMLTSCRFEKEIQQLIDELFVEVGINLDLDLSKIINDLPEAGLTDEAINIIQEEHNFEQDLLLPQYQSQPIHRMIHKRFKLRDLGDADSTFE